MQLGVSTGAAQQEETQQLESAKLEENWEAPEVVEETKQDFDINKTSKMDLDYIRTNEGLIELGQIVSDFERFFVVYFAVFAV